MTDKSDPKYPRYQDYVIKDAKLVGAFEEMYRDHDDPWMQLSASELTPDRAVALSTIRRLAKTGKVKRVLEVGCGLGLFTQQISDTGVEAFGADISPTAIEKAKAAYPLPTFMVGDLMTKSMYEEIQPDLIVMSEISWYVLVQLKEFATFCRQSLPHTYLMHILTFYPPGDQSYGTEYFTDFVGLKKFLPVNIIEEAEFRGDAYGTTTRSYFLGQWQSD